METLQVPEMWFRTGESFAYQFCKPCGSLQIAEIPENLQRYYPPEYFAAWGQPVTRWQRLREFLVAARNWTILFGPAPLYTALLSLPVLGQRSRIHALTALRSRLTSREASIVDVGGGVGQLLGALRRLSFRDLTCVDPYLPEAATAAGFTLLKCSLASVDRIFDVIMYHHTLEHVPDLGHELSAVRDHLSPGGVALLRLPILPNEAFASYGTHWVQIDPPRHLHIPSRSALRGAAERAGLRIVAEGDDSMRFQFWGSELALRGIPHHQAERTGVLRQVFGRRQLREFDRRATAINQQGRGDQGWFLLAHASVLGNGH